MTLRVDVKKIALVLVIMAGLIAGLAYVFPKKTFTEVVTMPVFVTVQERSSQLPVADARVVLKNSATDLTGKGIMDPTQFNRELASANTDVMGKARLTHSFQATGVTSLWGRKGRVVLEQNVRVEARGFQPFEAPLAAMVNPAPSFGDRSSLDIEINLYRQ